MNRTEKLKRTVENKPGNLKSHDTSHVKRVYRFATEIAKEEVADLQVVQAAALLHDISALEGEYSNHAKRSAETAEKILSEQEWDKEPKRKIVEAIREHSIDEEIKDAVSKKDLKKIFKRINSKELSSKESKILFDADRIDLYGAAGITRTIARWIEEDWDIHLLPTLYSKWIENTDKILHFQKSKEIVEPKKKLSERFSKELEKELSNRAFNEEMVDEDD